MTRTDIAEQLQKFEAHATSAGMNLSGDKARFYTLTTARAWTAWRAPRAPHAKPTPSLE